MGKKLIIKGADFSANGMRTNVVLKKLDDNAVGCVIVSGETANINRNASLNMVYDLYDVTEYVGKKFSISDFDYPSNPDSKCILCYFYKSKGGNGYNVDVQMNNAKDYVTFGSISPATAYTGTIKAYASNSYIGVLRSVVSGASSPKLTISLE